MPTIEDLQTLRSFCETPFEAVRLACQLEASAPKPGNVYPGRPFEDLHYRDFIKAAEIAANHFSDPSQDITARVLAAATETKQVCGTNVNLGILLLLGPLVAADERSTRGDWLESIPDVLSAIGCQESRNLFQAISISAAGGLGEVVEMDVHDSKSHDDIMAAMRLAQSYDRIALQYAGGFRDLTDNVVPIVYDSINEFADVRRGIVAAHLRLLAGWPDSLIARKNGIDVAKEVQRRAAQVDIDDIDDCNRFDDSLRSGDHKLNPGTTADLIAAALYVLLRTDHEPRLSDRL